MLRKELKANFKSSKLISRMVCRGKAIMLAMLALTEFTSIRWNLSIKFKFLVLRIVKNIMKLNVPRDTVEHYYQRGIPAIPAIDQPKG